MLLSWPTCRELHLFEALDGGWDALSLHQDVVLFAYTVVPCLRHAQDVARGSPAVKATKQVMVQNEARAPKPAAPMEEFRADLC